MRNYYQFSLIIFCLLSTGVFGTTADFTTQFNCDNENTVLTSTSTSKDQITDYDWDLTGNGLFTDKSGQVISHNFSAGTHSVGLRIITNVGDTVSVIKSVTIGPQPSAGFTYSNPCQLDTTFFTDASTVPTGTVANYYWDFGNGNGMVYVTNPKFVYPDAGTYQVQVVAISNQGCKDTTTQSVTIHPQPVVEFVYNPDTTEFYVPDSVVISLTNSFPTIVWLGFNGQDSIQSDSIKVGSTGDYVVRIIDDNGCALKNTARIIVYGQMELYPVQLLTPGDGYGVNDKWIIKNRHNYREIEVNVYNRYGDEVYSSDNYQNDWQGTYEDEPLPEGTYYYVIKILENGQVYKGALSILR